MNIGFFAEIGAGGIVRDLNILRMSINAVEGQDVGGLAGQTIGSQITHVRLDANVAGGSGEIGVLIGWSSNDVIVDVSGAGSVTGINGIGGLLGDSDEPSLTWSHSSATVNSPGGYAGGLVGVAIGQTEYIDHCFATGSVTTAGPTAGGLVADTVVPVSDSFATGDVTAGDNSIVGGFAGYGGLIRNSYATGAVNAGSNSKIGGLVGAASGEYTSYSIGAVSAGTGSDIGGLIGSDYSLSDNRHLYWDLETSGVNDPAQGAGNIPNDPGLKGLTDARLKSGLPNGFNPKVWGQSPNINNGYPYLLANPPPKK